jgi:putative PIN family toxin of toxin-antitoxin system
MAKSNSLRLIIDTNLWISFLISDRERKLDSLLLFEKIKILFSLELIEELTRTSTYPKLKKYLGPNVAVEMLSNLEPYIDLIEVKSIIQICRDPKDNFLLSLAIDGNADFLLTGDKDLLELKKIGKTAIMTISNFLQKK